MILPHEFNMTLKTNALMCTHRLTSTRVNAHILGTQMHFYILSVVHILNVHSNEAYIRDVLTHSSLNSLDLSHTGHTHSTYAHIGHHFVSFSCLLNYSQRHTLGHIFKPNPISASDVLSAGVCLRAPSVCIWIRYHSNSNVMSLVSC